MNKLDLNGTWKLRWSDGQRGRPHYAERLETDEARYIDATVPGEVHLDLLRAGLIPDPYVHAQAKDSRWVEDCVWSYRRFFDAPAEALAGRSWFYFEALDLAATIVLNGEKIGTHQNVFRPCRIEVTGKLKEGRNLLTVHVDSGLFAVSEKPHSGYLLQGFDQKLHKRHWLRKPQNQFSWDWSARLINVGISGGVELQWTPAAARLEQFAALADLSPTLDEGKVRGRFFVERLVEEEVTARLVMQIDGEAPVETTVTLTAGTACYEVELRVANPRLWWPTGHGAQERYTLTAELFIGGDRIATQTRRIGFRHIQVRQDAHPDGGRYFIFEINGRPIFLKGANLVPADMIFVQINRARYETLIARALEANFNFLRVWGGGIYESEDFYDLCDEHGIVVWQEFIYACGKYPLHDEAFAREAKLEAIHHIRRLAFRPSLIAWCGNNEMDMFNAWDVSEQGVVRADYAFFHLTLRHVMRAEDPGRYYQPSSPYSPDALPANQDDVGDQHPWSVGFQDVDFHQYRGMICRFPNEGGFLGPSSLPSMLSCLPETQRKIGSFAWQFHDNSVDSWEEPSPVDNITLEWLGRPIRAMTLAEYAYWGGLIQGEALREFIESFRRKMFSSSCACFWMFNDCWPATRSWTVVDYALRRTPSFHPVRRAFAPVHVVLAEVGGMIEVVGINEEPSSRSARLRYGVFTLAGVYPLSIEIEVTLPANSATNLGSFAARELIANAAAFAILLDEDGQLIARNRFFRQKFREMAWPEGNVQIRQDTHRAIFHSPTFVWGVCLDLDGSAALADNFFDLYPGMDYSLPWTAVDAPTILAQGNSAVVSG